MSQDRGLQIVGEQPSDLAAVEALVAKAFGPGRFVKTAERLRETNQPRLDLSFVAYDGERLAGCVRLWPIHIGDAPLIFLGPFAVDPDLRSQGLGARLIEIACEAAKAAGETAILLVGDLAYFNRLGFEQADPAAIHRPGPVDRRRVLLRRFGDGAEFQGLVRPG